MQNNRWLQTLLVLLVIIASAWLAGQLWQFLIQFSSIILLFFLSWLLAFTLSPVARRLKKAGLPYGISVAFVYLALALVFTIGGFLLIPPITSQVNQLIGHLTTGNNEENYISQVGILVGQMQDTLKSWGVKEVDLNKFYNDLAGQAQSVALNVLQNTFTLLQSIATLALQLILVLLLSFYFMKDGDRIFGGIAQILPPRWQEEARLVALSLEKSFGGFVRGQVVFALVYAILTAVVMMMPPFQLNYVVIASIVAGLAMIIPLIGNFVAFLPPILVCLVDPNKAGSWGLLLLALFIMQSLMMNLLGPRIMSKAIGIHPLYVVAAMLVGAQVAGFWGALFGIPVAGAANLIGRPLMRRVRYQTTLYHEPAVHSLSTTAFVTGPLAASMVANSSSLPTGPASSYASTSSGPFFASQPLLAQKPPAGSSALPAQPDVATPPAAPEPATQPHALPLADLDEGFVPRPPTLSARMWRLLLFVGSRLRARVQARRQKQSR
ncbi:MAG: AI-2E family transporter [Chloroflexota bacterium]|nr:AI-2E family transporter [Chloroflexota bacterium]